MASYTGPCKCTNSIINFNNITYPTNTNTLLANTPTTITWIPRNATSVSFRLYNSEGSCHITPWTVYHSCSNSSPPDASIVRQVPDNGSVTWTPSANLPSREDYWVSGRYDYFVDGMPSTVGMGSMYFTILRKEGDQVLVLPDEREIQREIQRGLKAIASASASSSTSGSTIVVSTSVTTPSGTGGLGGATTGTVSAGSGARRIGKMRWRSMGIFVRVIVALHV